MTQLRESRLVPVGIEEAFEYAADFTNIEQWDPGIAASEKVEDAPVGLGSRFELQVKFGSRVVPMTYEITEFDPPRRVILTGVGKTLTAIDEIRFTAVDEGTRIDYTADLEFSGFLRLLVPFMGGTLRKVGEKALDGLQQQLEKIGAT